MHIIKDNYLNHFPISFYKITYLFYKLEFYSLNHINSWYMFFLKEIKSKFDIKLYNAIIIKSKSN